jgi:hypothetical protein
MNVYTRNGWNLNEPRSAGGEVWMYNGEANLTNFVSRHKRGGVAAAKAFAKFLTANMTPEQYFAERAAGKAPLTILTERGYVSPMMKKALRLMAEAANRDAIVRDFAA